MCSYCQSDNIEEMSSMAARVVVCIILLFIPFGLFFCWVPFVFPFIYRCNTCGMEWKKEELEHADWRKKEELSHKQKELEEKLEPWMGSWGVDQKGRRYKITKADGHLLLFHMKQDQAQAYMIESMEQQEDPPLFRLLRLRNQGFALFKHQEKDFTFEAKEEDGIFTDLAYRVMDKDERNRLEHGEEQSEYKKENEQSIKVDIIPLPKSKRQYLENDLS